VRRLVLFDIDGTLVLTGGAGKRAITRAFAELFGVPDAFTGVSLAGRTDRYLVEQGLERCGVPITAETLTVVRERYLARLAEEIHEPAQGPKAMMPGVSQLLDALAERGHTHSALLTGNYEAGARIKLEHFDLWRYFRCGAYADDAADRNALVPFALQRARECGLPELPPKHILVVGDTPHDVACAHAVGATPVGVATGGFTSDQLRESGAEVVFENLADPREFLKLVDE